MDNILEKLGITKAPYYNSHDYSNVSRYVQNISDKLYPYIRDVEEQRNQMLEALIKAYKTLEYSEYGSFYSAMMRGTIEKATGKSWEEIKEILGEIK